MPDPGAIDRKTTEALAEACLRVQRRFSRGVFNPFAFIKRHKSAPPQALIDTLDLVARRAEEIKAPWAYAEMTLKTYKAPKANARAAEARQAEIKAQELRPGELNAVGAILAKAMDRQNGQP